MARKPRLSLAARLTRTLIAVVGGFWLLSLAGVGWYVDRTIDQKFDYELVESAHRLFETAVHEFEGAGTQGLPVVVAQPVLETYSPLVYQLRDASGRVLVRTEAAPSVPLNAPLAPGFHDSGPWRIYTAVHADAGRTLFLQLTDSLAERRENEIQVLLGLLWPTLILLPLLAWLLRAIARYELRVFNVLQADIARRGGGDLSPIPLAHMPDELHAVGMDVNRLLERLTQALDVERALAANAAHELRNPLAAVRLRLQTALDEGLARNHVQSALDALGVLSHRTEKLLQLSQAESAAALGQTPVDLIQLAATVAEEFWHSAALRQRLDLKVPEEGGPALTLGDVDTLALALRNLVENAQRYGGDGPVEIEVALPATLIVCDHGPGVDAQRLGDLQKRHVRHARDQAGYGLGLSIVATIVQKHRGRLLLSSPRTDAQLGFEARIELPPS